MAEIKNSESDMSTQQKAEQDWFNIAAVSWDSKAFLKDIHLQITDLLSATMAPAITAGRANKSYKKDETDW